MTFNNDQLQLVLNYDTNFKKVFGDFERMVIHSAISHKLAKSQQKDLPAQLSVRISNALAEIEKSGYVSENPRYYEDRSDAKIKLNNQKQ